MTTLFGPPQAPESDLLERLLNEVPGLILEVVGRGIWALLGVLFDGGL